jgi:hypothetical protein
MRKCPDCAEENINESLFCKHCGRCLLAPDPEMDQWSTATHTEHHKTHEGIDFYDGHIVKNSRVASLKSRHQTVPSVIGGRLLLLNLLVIILMSGIVSILMSEIARYNGIR